jgi:serine/threonine-protein phosphatase 2A regulatory subunit A
LLTVLIQAVESLNKICDQLYSKQVEDDFIPMVLSLSKADWFTSKISATGLYCAPYRKASASVQQGLRQQFGNLVHDETPMVRRQSANNLAKFIKEMNPTVIIEEIIPLFQYLTNDDQDSVRLLTVEILISIAEEIPKEQQSSHGVLLTSLRSLFEDKSWRVRYMVADKFEKVKFLAHALPENTSNLVHRLQKLSTTRSLSETLSPHLLSY